MEFGATSPLYTKQITIDVDDFYNIVNVLRDTCGCEDCKRIADDLLAQNREQLRPWMRGYMQSNRRY
jgi:hypothetical protein